MSKNKSSAIAILTTLITLPAFADLSSQMKNVTGDWDGGQSVIRITKMNQTTVKIRRCDRSVYFNSTNYSCEYDFELSGKYRADLDALYIAPTYASSTVAHGVCPFSLRYDRFNAFELMEFSNPYKLNVGCTETGKHQSWTKIRKH